VVLRRSKVGILAIESPVAKMPAKQKSVDVALDAGGIFWLSLPDFGELSRAAFRERAGVRVISNGKRHLSRSKSPSP
jgi:hypothetical protein